MSEQPDQSECFVLFAETTISGMGVVLNWREKLEKSRDQIQQKPTRCNTNSDGHRPQLTGCLQGRTLRWDFNPCIGWNLPASAHERQRNVHFTKEGADRRKGVIQGHKVRSRSEPGFRPSIPGSPAGLPTKVGPCKGGAQL